MKDEWSMKWFSAGDWGANRLKSCGQTNSMVSWTSAYILKIPAEQHEDASGEKRKSEERQFAADVMAQSLSYHTEIYKNNPPGRSRK